MQKTPNSKIQVRRASVNEQMPQTPPPLEPAPPSTEKEQSLVGRMLNIFAAPGDVFDSIKGKAPSHSNWLGPAVLLLIVSWLGAWLVLSSDALRQQMREASDKAIERQIKAQHMSEAQAEQTRQAAEKFGAIGQTVGYIGMPLIMAFVPPFVIGLMLWFVAQYALKFRLPYLKVVEITGLAAMISVLETIVRTLLILITGKLTASLSPTLLIQEFDPAQALHSLAIFANPFFFWLLMVRSIGLARFTGSPLRKAACWVFGLWFCYTGLFWALGWAMQQVAKKMGGQ
jgi:hypothetical protein